MRKRINHFAATMGAASLIAAGLIVGVGTSSHSESMTTVRNADATFEPSAHPTRAASESYAPPAKADPPCGFRATGAC
jgi:hypothetical protein